jgi:hypothetical protein
MYLLYSKYDDITNIESIAKLSFEQEFIIRLQAALLYARGGLHHKFNITSLHDAPNEDE